jgi:hypothetical protein
MSGGDSGDDGGGGGGVEDKGKGERGKRQGLEMLSGRIGAVVVTEVG